MNHSMKAYIPNETLYDIQIPENIRLKRLNAEKRMSVYHYTSLIALENIVRNKTFRLNRIDKVNDLREGSYLGSKDDCARCFIGCFSYQERESIRQWNMYTEEDIGVRIGLHFTADCSFRELINTSKTATLLHVDSEQSSIFSFSRSARANYPFATSENPQEYYPFTSFWNPIEGDMPWNIELFFTDVDYQNSPKETYMNVDGGKC